MQNSQSSDSWRGTVIVITEFDCKAILNSNRMRRVGKSIFKTGCGKLKFTGFLENHLISGWYDGCSRLTLLLLTLDPLDVDLGSISTRKLTSDKFDSFFKYNKNGIRPVSWQRQLILSFLVLEMKIFLIFLANVTMRKKMCLMLRKCTKSWEGGPYV